MATKVAFQNDDAPDLNPFGGSWGLKLTNFSELFFLTAHGDVTRELTIRHPGDPIAQSRHVLETTRHFVENAGYTIHDIVWFNITCAKRVTDEQGFALLSLAGEFFSELDVKPAIGVLRYVDRLGLPDMLVEWEFLVAR